MFVSLISSSDERRQMEKEIREAVARLQRIEAELGEPSEEPTKSDDNEEEPFEYSQRILLSDIQELKELIALRDKESLVCTNRRRVKIGRAHV